jgi:small subunit ribosomal protein S5e
MAAATEVKLFGKWSFEDIEVRSISGGWLLENLRGLWKQALKRSINAPLQVTDISLEDYIAVKTKFAVFVSHTAGRYQKKRFRKALCPIVERCVQGTSWGSSRHGSRKKAAALAPGGAQSAQATVM